MSLNKNKPETIEELVERIELVMSAADAMGGSKALSDYGNGWYDMAFRTVQALKHIQGIQKASEDASDDEKSHHKIVLGDGIKEASVLPLGSKNVQAIGSAIHDTLSTAQEK